MKNYLEEKLECVKTLIDHQLQNLEIDNPIYESKNAQSLYYYIQSLSALQKMIREEEK